MFTEEQLDQLKELAFLDPGERHEERLYSHWVPRLVDHIRELSAHPDATPVERADRQIARAQADRDRFRANLTLERRRNDRVADENAQLRGQLDDIEARVHRAFVTADEHDVTLDALTVDDLTRLIMHAIREGDETR